VPHVKVGDIQTYCEIHGAGATTLTMIRGLGADLSAWFPQVPEFSKHFRTVVFDNRGAGRTDKPDGPYSTRQMAEDVNGLLNALNIRLTAMLGVSMGGMIAQEFAINHPEKLSCLVLGCTSFGGPESVPPPHETWKAVLAGTGANEKTRRLQEQALFCDETIANNCSVIAEYLRARSMFPIPPHSLALQAAAISTHDAASRIGRIQTPTLVLTGKEDRLVPPENSRLIAARIPGAILNELPGGHLFMCEYPSDFNRAVIEFVKPERKQ
jgi:pimeloyl-ACP methyl ester carboxylesterase